MSRSVHATLLLSVLLIAGGCGNDNTPIAPTLPTPITEVFSGTLTPNGATTYPFVNRVSGEVRAALTAVGPDSNIVMGFMMGTWDGTGCQIGAGGKAIDRATLGTVIIQRVTAVLGTLCIRLYDSDGSLLEPVSYEVQVIHP